jgi:hypothetical protein
MKGKQVGCQINFSTNMKQHFFVNCLAHQLNLVTIQSTVCISECKIFFETLSRSAFFSKALKKLTVFTELVISRLPSIAVSDG